MTTYTLTEPGDEGRKKNAAFAEFIISTFTNKMSMGEKGDHQSPKVVPSRSPSSSFAHDWSPAGTGGVLRIKGQHFVDAYGRVCQLRGVNLSGACKTPINHDHDVFPLNHHTVTFVGRPFPLEDAPEHFSRLRRWGLTFVRFLVTWEAVEHEGRGIYDTEYLKYLRDILSLLPQYGMVAFVSVHQDVWSRYSGGSGAPAWTLEAVGFDLHALEDSGAAWLLGVKGGGHVEAERGIWPCGYQKLAAATMATCFWAGDAFASKISIKGVDGKEYSVQQYLQDAFLDMYDVLVRAVGDLECVLGFEMMNEPHRGYVDIPSLHGWNYNTDLHLSHIPSAFQSFMLGAGYPTLVPFWSRSFPIPTRLTSHSVLNSVERKAWRSDGPTQGQCLWEMHGVWGWDVNKQQGVVLRENYFSKDPSSGKKVDWHADYYYPFQKKWADRVRLATSEHKMIFVEGIPNELCSSSWAQEHQLSNMVYAPHWYDLNALFAKAFGNFTVNVQGLSRGMFFLKTFYWGQKGARNNYSLQIRNIVEAAYQSLGERPVIIGECGVPMDMNKKEAFRSNDWTWQARMMDAMITALERSLVGFTLWNYNPENDDERGDDWNGENFSWFSRTRAHPSSSLTYEQTNASLDEGGRILQSVVRPYPAKTAGTPLRFEYEMTTGKFVFEWRNPEADVEECAGDTKPSTTSRNTELFVPALISRGRKLMVRGLHAGDSYFHDEAQQTLVITPSGANPGKVQKITVTVDPPLRPPFHVNSFWGDFGLRLFAFCAIPIGVFIHLVYFYFIA